MLEDIVNYSARDKFSYIMNTIERVRFAANEDLVYTVTSFHTYTDYKDLRTYADYECTDDDGNVAGHFIVRMTYDCGSIEDITWQPEKQQEELDFRHDIASVSGFLEGIEVITD